MSKSDPIKIELTFNGYPDKESLEVAIKQTLNSLNRLVEAKATFMGMEEEFMDLVYREKSFFIQSEYVNLSTNKPINNHGTE